MPETGELTVCSILKFRNCLMLKKYLVYNGNDIVFSIKCCVQDCCAWNSTWCTVCTQQCLSNGVAALHLL